MSGSSPGDIARAARLVRRGKIVSYPTETLYGLAADALDPAAVRALLLLKGREPDHNIALLVADEDMLMSVIRRVPAAARTLMAAHWPGPLTIILPAATGLPPSLVSPAGGVGVRISSDPVAARLVRAVGGPITATSANRTGDPPATRASDARLAGVSLVLDGGERSSEASTVIELLQAPVVLRHGVIKVDLG